MRETHTYGWGHLVQSVHVHTASARGYTHFLAPVTTPFHAEVALGSTWKELPDLAGPAMSHL